MRRVFAAVVLLSIVLVGVSIVVRPAVGGGRLSAGDAESIVALHAPDGKMSLKPSRGADVWYENGGFNAFRDELTGDEYVVDRAAGYVAAYYAAPSTAARTQRIATSDNAALLAAATSIARRHYVGGASGVASMRPTIRRTTRGGRGGKKGGVVTSETEYEVEFRRFQGSVGLPDSFSVTFDGATGRFIRFLQKRDEVVVSLTPSTDASSAVHAASDAMHMPIYTLDSVDLSVLSRPGLEQSLVWEVAMHTGTGDLGATGFALIDAASGEVTEYDAD